MPYQKGIVYNPKYPPGTMIRWKIPPKIHQFPSVRILPDELPPKNWLGKKDIVPVMTNQGLIWIKEQDILPSN
jgi:hypothetical protein